MSEFGAVFEARWNGTLLTAPATRTLRTLQLDARDAGYGTPWTTYTYDVPTTPSVLSNAHHVLALSGTGIVEFRKIIYYGRDGDPPNYGRFPDQRAFQWSEATQFGFLGREYLIRLVPDHRYELEMGDTPVYIDDFSATAPVFFEIVPGNLAAGPPAVQVVFE